MIKSIKSTELKHGEIYLTTKEFGFSNYDDGFRMLTVPENEKLLFRSFQPYPQVTGNELVLFYWLKMKLTVCLRIKEQKSILYMQHVVWETRNEI